MNGFEKRRAEKKKVILESALKLFLEKDADNVTIKQIADEASVSHVSIYNFYGSKGELINEIALQLIDDMTKKYYEICSNNDFFDEKLKNILNFKIETLNKKHWNFVFDISKTNSTVGKALDEMLTYSKKLFISLIEEGKKTGTISSQIDNNAILLLIDIFSSYFTINIEARNMLNYNTKLAEDLQHIFWYGLLK